MLLQTYLILIPTLFHLTVGLLDAGDQSMYGNIFMSAFPYKDLKTAFQATSGLSKLGVNIMKQEKLCDFVKNEVNDKLDSIFFATSIKKLLKKCKFEISKSAEDLDSEEPRNHGQVGLSCREYERSE